MHYGELENSECKDECRTHPTRLFFLVQSIMFPINFLVRSRPTDGEPLGLELGMKPHVSNIIFPDLNSGVRCQYM